MKRTLLPFLALLAVGCTSVPTPHGTARFWGDYASVDIKDGPFTFKAVGMKHSPVARAHWRGGTGVASQVVGGAIGFTQPAIGAGAAILTPIALPRELP